MKFIVISLLVLGSLAFELSVDEPIFGHEASITSVGDQQGSIWVNFTLPPRNFFVQAADITCVQTGEDFLVEGDSLAFAFQIVYEATLERTGGLNISNNFYSSTVSSESGLYHTWSGQNSHKFGAPVEYSLEDSAYSARYEISPSEYPDTHLPSEGEALSLKCISTYFSETKQTIHFPAPNDYREDINLDVWQNYKLHNVTVSPKMEEVSVSE